MARASIFYKIGFILIAVCLLASQALPVFTQVIFASAQLPKAGSNTINKSFDHEMKVLSPDTLSAHSNWLSGYRLGAVSTSAFFTHNQQITDTFGQTTLNSVEIVNHKNTTQQFVANLVKIIPTNTPTPVTTTNAQPSATPTPDNTPSLAYAIPNANFEESLGGWAAKWIKSSDDFSLDTNSQANGGNSVRLVSNQNPEDIYLLSERFGIDSSASYKWETYIKASGVVTNLNFYIDEYNTWGDWIGTVWLGKMNTDYDGTLSLNYVPSTNKVRSVRLQYVSAAGNVTDTYFDSVTFSK